ncbi:hypothetical protein B0T26DRAFT_165905 [Lasiosphaeria miniovina]|uniref:Uncharacterized protein n=1 Tax=Lasiosphaeria miniovina TaxID=1954250 RepID=A0AA40B5U9_9PEZI|nr:uncharacterized protein B0T26DRAFT_165905 [Lasiosphaeria miniovina]KAK0728264.1 hypothetical protein B0T26DRAFT_165905 [Lasiosphaeria miniovina]
MGFGDSVAALLETYSNCLSLLKAFKRKGGNQLIEAEDHRAHLRKSLKSDRALVERAYSTRLSRSGSRLSKGDAPAVSALGRILKKLRAAIANLLRFSSTKQGLDLDYQSLMSLSNSSRVDAIKAIDRLSRRLDSPSRSSVVTSSSKTSSSPSASSRHKRHSSSSPDEAPRRSKTASPESAPKKTSSSSKDGKAVGKPKPESRARNPPAEKSRPAAKTSHRRTGSGEKRAPPPPAPPETAPPLPNRISFISISTDSTKLGEIPERKLRRRYPTADSSSDEYNVAPMYPLKPYTTEVKERRFWGMFGRNRDGRTAPSGH